MMALWHPMASIVTMQPLMARSFKSSGMAVISLDLLCVLSCPMTSPPFCEHQADTTCTGDSSVARSNDALTVLPSSETTAPWVNLETAWVHDRKH